MLCSKYKSKCEFFDPAQGCEDALSFVGKSERAYSVTVSLSLSIRASGHTDSQEFILLDRACRSVESSHLLVSQDHTHTEETASFCQESYNSKR